MPDPLDALRAPVVAIRPSAVFSTRLRERLERALEAQGDEPIDEEVELMTAALLRPERARNGTRHGDVSYLTLALPDAARGRHFYGTVLGWSFEGGPLENGGNQVAFVLPQVGIWPGANWSEGIHAGAIASWRVDDLLQSVAAVRDAGGTAEEPLELPYGLQSSCTDGRGLSFWLHQLAAPAGDPAPPNGEAPGDVSYLVLRVADLEHAQQFFTAVFGWSSTSTSAGAQIDGCVPMTGMSEGDPGLTLCYRVDDLAIATQHVTAAGGEAGPIEAREYGREALCRDDQGVAFYLHELV